MSRKTDKRKKEKGEGKMQVLTVEVVEGRDLIAMDDDGTSDPYVIVLVGKEKFRTKIIRDTLNPCWDIGSVPELFTFRSKHFDSSTEIVLKCMDWDRFSSDDRMGMITLPLSEISDGQEHDGWYPLKPQKSGDAVSGELHLRFKLVDNEKYQPIHHSMLWRTIKSSSHLGTIEELLKSKDANLLERGADGLSLIHMAVKIQSEIAYTVLIKLLEHPNSDVNLVDDIGNTCLHSFCADYCYPECEKAFKLFLKKGAQFNAINKHKETPLHRVIGQLSY